MANFALSSTSSLTDIVGGLNYVLHNLNTNNYGPNVANLQANVSYIANTGLFANNTTGHITIGSASSQVFTNVYQYMAVAFANSADGSSNFGFTPTNKNYYGVRNNPTGTISSNPADYVWYAVPGGFGTTKTLYYTSYGLNGISWYVGTTAPNATYVPFANTAIDLNVITNITIPNNFITNQQILNNTLTGAKIALGTITGNLITSQTLTGNLIALNTITGNLIVPGTIYGNAILANTLQASAITAGTITGTQLQAGLLVAGNIVSNNATFGSYFSPGYWMNYTTGDANFGGAVYVGNNLIVEGLIQSSSLNANTVSQTTIVPGSVTNSKQAYYASNQTTGGQNLYKIPKLINYTNSYDNGSWAANGRALVLAATITPTDENSTIIVQYNTTYYTDTGNTANAWVGLYRSRNEGYYNAQYGGTYYSPYQPNNHRKVKIAAKDPNSTSAPSFGYTIIGGQNNVSNTPTVYTNMVGDLGIWANTTVANNYSFTSTGSSTNSWANLIYGSAGFGIEINGDAINGVYFNGNVKIEYPVGGISAFRYYIQDTSYEPWGVYNGNGNPVNHPYLAVTDISYYPYSPPNTSQILRMPDDTIGFYLVDPIVEANIATTSLNGIAQSVAAYGNTKTNFTAIAVGTYGTIVSSSNRNYTTSGVYSNSGAWVAETVKTQYGNTYTGNLNAIAYAAPAGVMDQSSYVLGANAAANSSCSSTWVAVGENGGVVWRANATTKTWTTSPLIPVQHQRTTFRSVCYDAYRYRWWAVGDYGAIIWADDRALSDFNANNNLVWNTYNSGTLRNLYSIAWDPVTTNWTAVGDGIVMTDNGLTIINGQRTYPGGKAYAYDSVAAGVGAPAIYDYEPTVLEAQMTNANATVIDCFQEYHQTTTGTARDVLYNTSNATTITNGADITSVYIEPPASGNNPYSWGHYSGVPITFYLVAGADPTSNVIVGNPVLTITEYKR